MSRTLSAPVTVVSRPAIITPAPTKVSPSRGPAIRMGLGGGASLPSSSTMRTGRHGVGFVLVGLPASPLGIRADVMYDRHEQVYFTGQARLTGGSIDLVRGFGRRESSVKPYLVGGLAYYNVAVSGPGIVTSPQAPHGSVHLTFGAGLNLGRGPLGAFVEARFIGVDAGFSFLALTGGVTLGPRQAQ